MNLSVVSCHFGIIREKFFTTGAFDGWRRFWPWYPQMFSIVVIRHLGSKDKLPLTTLVDTWDGFLRAFPALDSRGTIPDWNIRFATFDWSRFEFYLKFYVI
jgi:hypothetical protein